MKSVIVLSIPRSGTHLVMKLLGLLGFKEHYITTINDIWLMPEEDHFCFASHIWHTPDNVRKLKESGYKAIYISRDPRDVTISLMFYIYKQATRHGFHIFMKNLKDNDERIKKTILGISNKHSTNSEASFPSIRKRYEKIHNWRLEEDNVYHTIFENLVGEKGKGNFEKQNNEIIRIIKYLGFISWAFNIQRIRSLLYGATKYKPNFRKGIIGDWKNHFSEENKILFKQECGQILWFLGYEKKEMNW